MEPSAPGQRRSRLEALQALGRALAGCDPRVDELFACIAAHLNGAGFGYERVALFKDGTGRFDPVPAAQHGFDDLEVLHGQLPPLDGWPLFQRALDTGSAVWAEDAQLNGDIPLEVAGALRLQSIIGIP